MERPPQFRISFCIATFNRAGFLGETLAAIISEATSDCEIVISDNASTDTTEQVVHEYARRFGNLRYARQETNVGPDRNFDSAVQLAQGEFCWLMPDDDLLRPGAVATVMQAIRPDVSLIVANAEVKDFTMSKILQQRCLDFESDRIYEPPEMDRLFTEASSAVGYCGGVIIRREVWLTRDRERFFDSYFVHVGVVYQAPLPGKAVVIAQPLISIRTGNAYEWWAKLFDLHMNGPALLESYAISESTKRAACSAEPWKDLELLLWLRALGVYSLREYRRQLHPRLRTLQETWAPYVISVLPGTVVNTLFVLYYQITRRPRYTWPPERVLQLLSQSPFHFRKSKNLRRNS